MPALPDLVIRDAFPDIAIDWRGTMPIATHRDLEGSGSRHGTDAAGGSAPGPFTDGAGPFTAAEVDRAAALTSRGEPRYPATLRAAGIEGRVIARFVVDTAGRVEASSIEIRASSHERFTGAVEEVLRRARFDAATVGGRRVRQLVELPFVFSLAR